ncbi:endonuclease [Tahibacter caeni]|uniref:endonuclease n=1 Tax=Tahibacter caeni TaxID=1453545 RepID=UPI0021488136|nr:endonuclease [Tahibacter caeni]
MPEGPSIVILREQAAHLTRMCITHASGNTRLDTRRLVGQTIVALRSWGKHFLIEFEDFSLRVHFLLFGSYRIDERREGMAPRLSLSGARGELNLYACSLRWIEQPLDDVYDWRTDVMSDQWSAARARRKLVDRPKLQACDALLDQEIFAGVGNIIKNEALFRIRVHPLSTIGALPVAQHNALVREARTYAFEFLEWKKAYELKKHWLVHTRQICPRCGVPLEKAKLGTTQRRSFFCNQCQVLYGNPERPEAAASHGAVARARSAARKKAKTSAT